ncbi:MAG TPA: acetyl hydrolase [Treponema sp.]|nr:acetyl hydrolase [Treponema sp.]
MKEDRKSAIKKLRNLVFTKKMEPEDYRENFEKTFSSVFLPNGVECAECTYGGVPCDKISPTIYSSRRIVIYIHGGSFVGGSRNSYRNFCASLANESSCRIIVPEFRLPPTYPFPASIDDLTSVFRAVYEEENALRSLEIDRTGLNDKNKKGNIILAADGSGASLAMALLFKINKKYRDNIQSLVLFSPWLDLSSDNPLIAGRKVSDEIISGENLHSAVDKYTYATNITNPLVSPLKAPLEYYEEFPPVYVQMGEKEILVQQSQELSRILKNKNIECILDIWPKMMYMFQFADEYLPESHLAVEKVGRYIKHREEETTEEKKEREKILRKNNIAIEV